MERITINRLDIWFERFWNWGERGKVKESRKREFFELIRRGIRCIDGIDIRCINYGEWIVWIRRGRGGDPRRNRAVNIPVSVPRCSQYLHSKLWAMNSCSLSEMTFYLMFTFSLFISRVIGYAKYRYTPRERERERERGKIKSVQLFLTSEEQCCRRYIYIGALL